MEKIILFGIGCFHFGLKKVKAPSINGQDYVVELKRALESIPNANNITINASDDFKTELLLNADEPLSSLKDGVDFFPPPSFDLDIDFELYIPERLQKEFYPMANKFSLPTEKFFVHIRDTYHFPVTFVELIDTTEECAPSDAVVIVREFLEKHFSEVKSEFIRFDFLGPSPFHANFYISENKNNKTGVEHFGFDVEYLPEKGYDTFNFYFDKSLYSDLEEAKDSLFIDLSDEVGLYYYMVHTNLLQMRQWEALDETLQELLKNVKAKGMKAIWNKTVNADRQIQNLIIELSEFEGNQIFTSFSLKSNYQDLLHDGNKPCLDVHIKDYLDNFPLYPTNQVRDILNLLESRRSKTVDNFIVLISAVLGGVIGALITLLLSP